MSSQKTIESLLCRVASQVLKKDESEIDVGKSFAEQGGDTLQAVFFAGQCRDVGLLVDMMDVSLCGTLSDLARKLVDTHPQFQSSEATDGHQVSIPFTQLQDLYNTAGLCHASVWEAKNPISHHEAEKMLEQLVERHPMLGASLEVEEKRVLAGTTSSPSGSLVPYESEDKCTSRVKELQIEASKSKTRTLNVLYFGDASQIKKIGLVAAVCAIDAQSWHILLEDIQMYSSGASQRASQSHTFFDWVEEAEQKTASGHEVDPAQGVPVVAEQLPQNHDDSGVVSSSTFTLSLGLTESLYNEQYHQTLRTELQDLLFSSLASSFQDQLPGQTRYLEIKDGRPRDDGDAWDTVIGCFDELAEVPYHCSGDALDAARSAKDGRRRSHSSSIHSDEDCYNFVFDTTTLRRRRNSGDSLQPVDKVPRQNIGGLLAQSLGGLYVLPFWTDRKLSFLVMCDARTGGEAELKANSEKFANHLHDTLTKLANSRPLPTLSDFPHVSMDYTSLDRLFGQKLRHIAEEPLAEIENIYPCSPIQENFLVSSSLDKGAYTCTFTVKVSTSGRFASCDAGSWVAAWTKVVDKHSALRTIFVESEGRQGHFDQIVLNKVVPRVDIVAGAVTSPEVVFEPLEVAHHLTIGQSGQGKFLLVLTISHALTDGHSAEVILSDMCSCVAGYDGNSGKKVLSYSDYVLDQQLSPKDPVSDYWPKYLLKTQETQLPVTRDVDDLSSFDTVSSVMPINVASIDRLCQQHNINLASVCQFAWGVVLRSYVGVDDVCFSYISSVRHIPLKGIMTAVGPLITTLLCSMSLEGDANVIDAVKAVNSDYQDSLSHEAELADAVSTRRWSNTVMSFRRRLVQDNESLPGLSCKLVQGISPTNYDVSLIISAGQTDMEVNLDYWGSRMDRSYAQSLVQNFQEALHSIFRDIGTTIGGLELVSEEQKQWILERNARVPEGLNRCVHELINDRIQHQPTAVAIDAWDGSMTYEELDQSVSQLTQRLTDMGIGPEVPVGLCMDKSKLVPVIMFAILRAGGAVVPIGTKEPIARVEAIIADSSPIAVICDGKQVERLSSVGTQILDVKDVMAGELPKSSTATEKGRPKPGNTAWIFYTSGSTGTPKGVLVQHSALATSMHAHGIALGMTHETRVLQFAAHTFDVSLAELCTTLIYGGCVCIPSEEDRINDLVGSARRLQVNVLSLTSSVASTIAPQDVPLVNKLILFGEEVKASVVETWLGKAAIINAYGPTESSIFASVNKPFQRVEDRSNIGFPMSVNLWVTDPQNPGRLCPPGAPGEMLIEGPLLARGYLNDEEKTAAAFIHDPEFASSVLGLESGRRFYRTGDIVRQNSDYSITYVGRIGTQIKIRGQRLDVAEVEHWITKLIEGVPRAVVGLLPAIEGDASSSSGGVLYAAIDFSENTTFACQGIDDILAASEELREVLNQLRNTLQAKLPSYMIPTFYVPFRRIPLTSSGKTDRKLIRRLIGELSATDLQSYVSEDSGDDSELLSETAQKLQGLWAAVLGVSSTSIKASDHFLYRGGDSVSAIKLVEAARLEHVQMTVLDVLSFPRLEDLARVLDERKGAANENPAHGDDSTDPDAFSLWQPSSSDREVELADIANQCEVGTTEIEDIYPCTPLQQSMLAATQQRPTAYLVRRVYALSESIDLDRFRHAWQIMIDKAPLMRTRILLGQRSGNLQVLLKSAPAWQYHVSLEKYVAEDQARVMAVGQPLMRFALVQETDSHTRYFVWTAHHSVYDGWSAQLIYRRLAALYLRDEIPPAVPFTRFIEHLQGDDLRGSEAASFWRRQLEGEVPSAFPSMPSSYYQPKPVAILHSEVDKSVVASSRPGQSLANVVRAAWAMTLSQYLGTGDVVFGATLSGRNASVAGITELVAPTITTVPVRIHVDRDENVAEYLGNIQSQAVEMIPFEHTGLQDIKGLVPDLQSAADVKHVLIIEPSPIEKGDALLLPGMDLVNTAVEAFDTFALTLQCYLPSDNKGSIKLEARFDSHVVSESQVAVLLQQLRHWVSQFADGANRDRRLSSLEGVTSTDLAEIKRQNATAPVRDDTCLHHLVQSVVREQPASPAICAWDGDFTYHELQSHARKLAHHLASLGVGPEIRVGLCMDKSKWTVVAMLAILESGGVVVLLGAQYPVERLRAIVDDCQARVILTNAAHAARLAGLGPSVVDVNDALVASIPTPPGDVPICPELKSHHPAWIVYTSGSTGSPKGSLLIHGGMATSLPAHGRPTKWSKDTRTLQFSAHTFDVCIQEIMTTLIFGGCVCIPSEDQRINTLSQFITDMNVNTVVLTSTVASTLNPSDLPSVTQLQLVGEQAKPSVVERWLGRAEIINIYGPSECSVYSSCSRPMQRIEDAPNIGFPLDACNFWITSIADHNQLCPIGVPGELLIENAWEAQEYVNNPELTAKSFVIEPEFAKQLGMGGTGRRMYRTGDLVRQNPDGSYTHLGRIDTQVKYRGHRVDLGEIEYWIGKLLDGVRTAVVDLVDLQAGKGAGDLVAVMDFTEDCDLFDPEEIEDVDGVTILSPSTRIQKALCGLKDTLSEKLPAYMVPTAYLPWQKVPLNPSGKTNRYAVRQFLTGLDSGSSLVQRYLADEGIKEGPRTEMGKQLQQLWAEVLSIDTDSIGAQDHFTRLGGDSLAAMKLVAAGRQVGLDLTVASIFTYPILDDFASFLESEQQAGTERTADEDPAPFELALQPASPDFQSRLTDIASQCRVTPEQVEDVYPCTPMQEALFAITAREPTTYTYRQVFRASQDIDIARFKAAWDTVAKVLPILRTRIVLDRNSGFLQAVVDAPLEWYRGSDLHGYLQEDQASGFEAGRPLLRCALIEEQSTNTNCFVLTTHHSMFDKWSLQRVFENYLYPAYAGGEMAKVVPYPRFIRYVLNTDVDAASQFWNQSLGDGDAFTDFPSLSSMGSYQPKPTSLLKQTVRASEQAELQAPFPSLLRAAWALTVAQYAAVEDVLFAVNLSGRSAPVAEITDMAAPTFVTVPVRVRVHGAQKIQDFLHSVHREAVDMIPHEHIGLQKIKKLVPTFSPADMRHLFLVHPASDSDTNNPLLRVPGFEEVHLGMEPLGDYALAVLCKMDEHRNEATVEARFDSAVIPEDRLKSILRQFEHNVTHLSNVTTEEQTIGSLQLANPQDVAQISKWNLNVQELSLGCIHDPVRNTVQERPEAEAICSWDGQLTYKQLDHMARALAHVLVAEGNVGPEVAVGFCMDKSRLAIVAMLAILYAGGAVVPLGVQLPVDRLSTIVKDCSAAMVLCDQAHLHKFEALGCKSMVVNDSTFENIEQTYSCDYQDVPSPLVRPDNMAWVMYTSGSTGTPKGVALPHRGLCSSLLGKGGVCKSDPTFRVFQFSAYTFDVSISDILITLSRGGTVCVPSESERMNDLVGAIQRMNVNFLNITASTAALISPSDVPAVKMLVLGGEGINPALIEKWRQGSNATLINSYGPAECSISSTMNPFLGEEGDSSVIGRALPGTRTWVVDPHDHNRLAPIGAVGELLIEGPHLARGYLNDAVKTSKSFITDPGFVEQVGSGRGRRMYRTGDLVRYNGNGSLSIIGRGDSQVKIRGQRVDLAEIEFWIFKLVPDARTVVVEYFSPNDAQRALVAAVEFLDPEYSDLSSISAWLKTSLAEKLPAYMVPRVYVQMNMVPKTASGKTDRRAVRKFMAAEGFQRIDQVTEVSEPGTVQGSREALVRGLWAAVLGVEEGSIDRQDNFFDLGADSISAMKLVAAAKSEGLEIKVVDIFKNPVLYKLSASAKDQKTASSEQASQQEYRPFQLLDHVDDPDAFLEEVICPVTGTRKQLILDAFPATDAVAFNVVGALTSSQTEVNTFVLDTESQLDLDQLEQSCMLLGQYVEAFRTVFVLNPQNGKLLHVVLKSYQHNVQMVKVNGSIESATEELVDEQMRRPFELGRPMVDMAILHQGEGNKTRVLFRMSHALYDGLSLPIIRDTLGSLYDSQGALQPGLSSFSDYVHDLTPHTGDENYSYWRNLLDGSVMPQLSPATKPNNQAPLRMDFTAKKVIPLARLKGEGITTSAIVNCAWAHVLAQYTGRDDVVFGETISGRNLVDPAISGTLVGCCATHVPLRVRFDGPGDKTVLDLLYQVRDQQRSRIPHEGVGFRTIIRDCTDWTPSTRFTSIVNHRPARSPSTPGDGQIQFSVGTFVTENQLLTSWYDLAVISQEEEDIVNLSLGYSPVAFDSETAQALLEDLADTVHIIMNIGSAKSDTTTLYGSVDMPKSSPALVNLQAVESSTEEVNGDDMDADQVVAAESTPLNRIWSSVFASKSRRGELPPIHNISSWKMRQTPFYELGGDILDVAYLVTLIERHRKTDNQALESENNTVSCPKVTIDDILRHPSLVEFAGLLYQRQIELD